MNKSERRNRVIARGEHSGHSHIIVGDAEVKRNSDGEIIITMGNMGCVLRHIMETSWVESESQVHTGEHGDIVIDKYDHLCEIGQILGRQGDVALEKIADRTYKYIPQTEYDPYEDKIREVRD